MSISRFVMNMARRIPWLWATPEQEPDPEPEQKKKTDHFKISPQPGSERITAQVIRNDRLLATRLWMGEDTEMIISLNRIDESGIIPFEITIAVPDEEKDGHPVDFYLFAGAAVAVHKCGEQEFNELREKASKSGRGVVVETPMAAKVLRALEEKEFPDDGVLDKGGLN